MDGNGQTRAFERAARRERVLERRFQIKCGATIDGRWARHAPAASQPSWPWRQHRRPSWRPCPPRGWPCPCPCRCGPPCPRCRRRPRRGPAPRRHRRVAHFLPPPAPGDAPGRRRGREAKTRARTPRKRWRRRTHVARRRAPDAQSRTRRASWCAVSSSKRAIFHAKDDAPSKLHDTRDLARHGEIKCHLAIISTPRRTSSTMSTATMRLSAVAGTRALVSLGRVRRAATAPARRGASLARRAGETSAEPEAEFASLADRAARRQSGRRTMAPSRLRPPCTPERSKPRRNP